MRNLLPLILMISALPVLGQQSKNIFKVSLTEKEKQTYVLNVGKDRISKVRDTIWDNQKWEYVTAQGTLSNYSNDTLTYINMACSTYDIFTSNNKNIRVMIWGCDSNIPHEYKIPPHKDSVFNFRLNFDKDHSGQKFRIGMYLIRPKTSNWYSDYLVTFLNSNRDLLEIMEPYRNFKNCLIWSNEVTIPKS